MEAEHGRDQDGAGASRRVAHCLSSHLYFFPSSVLEMESVVLAGAPEQVTGQGEEASSGSGLES
jgi:hypothetical protein